MSINREEWRWVTADGSFASIGRKYGISDVMVSRIKHRKAWREATCQLTNA